MLKPSAKIYVAGHRGLVGSAIWNNLLQRGYTNLIGRTHHELDLLDPVAVRQFFDEERPDAVVLAAAHVGGIMANLNYRADFITQNLQIQQNVIGESFRHQVQKLLFLGSTCIYPRMAPQPMTEDALLTSPLEYTNEPYAIAKIAGLKMCESFNLQYGTNYIAVMPHQSLRSQRQLPFGKQPCTAGHDAQVVSGPLPGNQRLERRTARPEPSSGRRYRRQPPAGGDIGSPVTLWHHSAGSHAMGNRHTAPGIPMERRHGRRQRTCAAQRRLQGHL